MKRIEIVELISNQYGGIKVKSEPNVWISPHPEFKNFRDIIKDIRRDDEIEIDGVDISGKPYYKDIKVLKKAEIIPVSKDFSNSKEKNWDKIDKEKLMNYANSGSSNNAYLFVTCLINNKIVNPKDIEEARKLVDEEKIRAYNKIMEIK